LQALIERPFTAEEPVPTVVKEELAAPEVVTEAPAEVAPAEVAAEPA
jgi:hypothetical protein